MAAYNFPNSPSNGDTVTVNGITYTYSSSKTRWVSSNSVAYSDSYVDAHLNTSTASTNEVLSYNGSDYDWVAQSGIGLTDLSVTTASVGTAALSYNNSTGAFTYTPPDLSSYATSAATVYSLTGTDIDPANGGIQTKTVAANTTFTESLTSGESVVLMLDAGASYTITWPTITWVRSSGNSAPTLTANDTLVLWKVSTTLYGAYVGSYE